MNMAPSKKKDSHTDKSAHQHLSGKEDKRFKEKAKTERGVERQNEDDDYVPVIIKRTDESIRHPDDALEGATDEGLEQLQRPFLSLVLSSVGAGLILGFTAMAVAVMATLTSSLEQPLLNRLSMAIVYPLGFIICIMSGTQLFTEHTATAVYPFLAGKAGVKKLLRLWLVVIVGNEIGAFFSATLLVLADDVIMARDGYILIGHHLVDHSTVSLLISSLLAGWLMALGGWLIMVTSPALSQMACIFIVTFLIGLGGLHHSIAGSVEMFIALFISDQFTFQQGLRFISLAIIGNLIGGSIFVAGFNYSHIRKTQQI